MEMVKRLAGLYLAIVGAVVAVHFVIDPLIYEWAEGDGTPVLWIILDWLMAAGLAIALLVTFEAKRGLDGGSDVREYISANVKFYVAAALMLLLPLERRADRLGCRRPDAGRPGLGVHRCRGAAALRAAWHPALERVIAGRERATPRARSAPRARRRRRQEGRPLGAPLRWQSEGMTAYADPPLAMSVASFLPPPFESSQP